MCRLKNHYTSHGYSLVCFSLLTGMVNKSIADSWCPPQNRDSRCKPIGGLPPQEPPPPIFPQPIQPKKSHHSLCQIEPTPDFLPPPAAAGRFYIFHSGGKPHIDLNWHSMPDPVQQEEAIRPKWCYGYDSQGEGSEHNSLKLNFIFKRHPAKNMGITLLSEADCFGDKYRCNPTYNLSQYSSLVFSARGEKGDEKIQVKAAFSSQIYGDSAQETIVYPNTGLIHLTSDWREYKISLGGVDLSRIITPFSITAQAREALPEDTVIIFLDEIYYE